MENNAPQDAAFVNRSGWGNGCRGGGVCTFYPHLDHHHHHHQHHHQ